MSRLTCGHIQHIYSWWWARLSPETCRVKPLRRIKTQLLHLVGLIHYYKAWCSEPQILKTSPSSSYRLHSTHRVTSPRPESSEIEQHCLMLCDSCGGSINALCKVMRDQSADRPAGRPLARLMWKLAFCRDGIWDMPILHEGRCVNYKSSTW